MPYPNEYMQESQKLNNCFRQDIIVEEFMSLQGSAKGNRLYSSTIVNMYLFILEEGKDPLKSIFSLSKG